MRKQNTAQFDTLARETAATVRATVRKWWLDTKDGHLLHIEAERAFVGARPVVVHFSVPLSNTRLPTPIRQPQMVIGSPTKVKPRKVRTTRQKARPAGRKTRARAAKVRPAARKTRTTASKAHPAVRKARPARRANTSPRSRQQQHKRVRSTNRKTRRTSS